MPADFDIARALDMTRELADDCARAALARCGDVHTRSKADGSLVTEVDTQTERRIRSVLTQAYPTHSIFGEEDGAGGEGGSVTLLAGPSAGARRAMIREIEAEKPLYRHVPTALSRHGLRTWEVSAARDAVNE